MVASPCCCMSLQSGVKIMAIIDVILDSLNILSVCLAIAVFVGIKEDNNYSVNKITTTDAELNVGIGVLAVLLIFAILGLLLSLRLYFGANKRDIRNCKIWLIMTTIILAVTIILNIVGGTAGDVNTANMTSSIINFLYRLYMIWVVYAFIIELTSENSRMGFQARLEHGMDSYPNAGMANNDAPPAYPQQLHNYGSQEPTSMHNPNSQYNNFSGNL